MNRTGLKFAVVAIITIPLILVICRVLQVFGEVIKSLPF